MAEKNSVLNRRWVIKQLLEHRGDALVISSLGNPTYDVASAGDVAENFYLWGAMGGAATLALGVAIAQPNRRVLAIVGDGEMMMALGSLATIACEKQPNLSLVVLDNERYAETGMQPTHTGRGVDLCAMALAAGFEKASFVRTQDELHSLAVQVFSAPGPFFASVKVSIDPNPVCLPSRDGPYLRTRFREAAMRAS